MPGFLALPYLATLADLAAAFDDRDMAAEVYPRLLPYADLFICSGAGVIGIEVRFGCHSGSRRAPWGGRTRRCVTFVRLSCLYRKTSSSTGRWVKRTGRCATVEWR
ncbi:MAG: hypothetical protein ACXV5Q_03295 [Frankiaceae bacterium]